MHRDTVPPNNAPHMDAHSCAGLYMGIWSRASERERYTAFDRAAFLAAMAAIDHERSAVIVPESCHSEAASISSGHSPATDERP